MKYPNSIKGYLDLVWNLIKRGDIEKALHAVKVIHDKIKFNAISV